ISATFWANVVHRAATSDRHRVYLRATGSGETDAVPTTVVTRCAPRVLLVAIRPYRPAGRTHRMWKTTGHGRWRRRRSHQGLPHRPTACCVLHRAPPTAFLKMPQCGGLSSLTRQTQTNAAGLISFSTEPPHTRPYTVMPSK